jgi:hypothetical protein
MSKIVQYLVFVLCKKALYDLFRSLAGQRVRILLLSDLG